MKMKQTSFFITDRSDISSLLITVFQMVNKEGGTALRHLKGAWAGLARQSKPQ